MKLTLSISHASDSFSNFQKHFCASPEKILSPLFLPSQSQDTSQNDFPVSDPKLKEPEFCFGMKTQEKNCLKKHEKIELELKRLPQERVEDESMLAFRGQLDLATSKQKVDLPEKKPFELGENLNPNGESKDLVFKHLKQLDFDEEDQRKKEAEQKDRQFELFFKNVSTKSGTSQAKGSTQYNFGAMNLKSSGGFHAPMGGSGLSDNFGFKVFEHLQKEKRRQSRGSLKQAIDSEQHVDLKEMYQKNRSIKDNFKEFLRVRNQKLSQQTPTRKERKSLQSTGLRKQDVIFRGKGRTQLRPMTLFKLTSFLNQTPELVHKKKQIFGFLKQKSMRSIAMNSILTPRKEEMRQSRTSIRKRSRLDLSGSRFSQLFQNLGTPDLTKRNFDLFNESTQEHLSKLGSKNTLESVPGSDEELGLKKSRSKSGSGNKLKKLLSSIQGESANKASKSKKKGCRCKKTQCTRLHCICFRERGYCGDECGCTGCLNREKYSETIKKIKDFTKEINPLAFQSKIQTIGLESGQKIHNRGCSCTKNQCLKNYCECHKNGLSCSPLCKCEDCKNDKVDINIEQVKEIFKKCSRKKKKFVIFLNKEKPTIKKIHI